MTRSSSSHPNRTTASTILLGMSQSQFHCPTGRRLRRHPCPGTVGSCNRTILSMPAIPRPPTKERNEGDHALDRLAERVDGVGDRLIAILRVDGAQIGNFHHDAVGGLGSRSRVHSASQLEAPSARIPGTRACRSTEGKLVHRGRIAGCGLAARCRGCSSQRVRAGGMPCETYQDCRSSSKLRKTHCPTRPGRSRRRFWFRGPRYRARRRREGRKR